MGNRAKKVLPVPSAAKNEEMPDGTLADYKSLITEETTRVRLLYITPDKKAVITDLDGSNKRTVSAWKIKKIQKEQTDGKTS
jgi:hypothetical protein